MLLARTFSYLAQYVGFSQDPITSSQTSLSDPSPLDFSISTTWSALGPFQIGTRESPWSSDPLELYGGFHSLQYDPKAAFKTPLAFNGTLSWFNFTSELSHPTSTSVRSDLSVNFLPTIDWPFLQEVYGWAGHQWLGWVRSEIEIKAESTKVLALHTRNVIEFWIDDVRHFGGDFYGYKRAATTLHLTPGIHQIDVKLVDDVRAVGGVGDPIVDISIILMESSEGLSLLSYTNEDVLMSDVIGGDFGPLASPYATVAVRNDAQRDIYIHGLEGMRDLCLIETLVETPIKLVPGQTRPIGFQMECIPSYDRPIYLYVKYRIDGEDQDRALEVFTRPKWHEGKRKSHKMTYVHPSGVVSYAMLRPPSENAACGNNTNHDIPVIVGLHGADSNANDYDVEHSMDGLPDLCSWFVIPQGTTPWSGDDWHSWGLADVEAALAAIPMWIERVDWDGPGADINTWVVSGHSNGGQGVWYVLTHRPDNVIGAAALSGYSSIENYVPYVSWRTADPGKTAVVQGSLSSYRHDLLMENAQDIPVILQHGSKDDNVPAYHSRLMDMRIEEARGDSVYFEVPDERHVWEGIATTPPLRRWFKEILDFNATSRATAPVNLRAFSVVVANPGDTGPKNGVQILQLRVPGQLGRMDFTYDPITGACVFRSSNVIWFRLSPPFDICDYLYVDGQELITPVSSSLEPRRFTLRSGEWQMSQAQTIDDSDLWRTGRQLGALDSILRTNGAFKIVRHSKQTKATAVQVSRNLCQYYAADTEVTDDYEDALSSEGNVISIGIGNDIPFKDKYQFPIIACNNTVRIEDPFSDFTRIYEDRGAGLAAIFLRPLPRERLELVLWGIDVKSLEVAARLVPMMTGSGQPDFVVTDQSMMYKGVQGTLALGFFDGYWEVSRNSFFEY